MALVFGKADFDALMPHLFSPAEALRVTETIEQFLRSADAVLDRIVLAEISSVADPDEEC